MIVRPSDLKRFIYCPRLPIWDILSPHRPPFVRRLKMFKGNVYHVFKELFSRGIKEELMETVIDGTKLIGKPDLYRVFDDKVLVKEVKSYKPPKEEYDFKGVMLRAYPSDLIQLLCYGRLLLDKFNLPVIMVLSYRGFDLPLKYDGVFDELLRSAIDDYVFTIQNLIVKDVQFDEVWITRKCSNCQYLQLCIELEKKCW